MSSYTSWRFWTAVSLLAGWLLPISVASHAATSVQLAQPEPGQLLVAHFALNQSAKVKIEAVGLIQKHSEEYVAYAWVLDRETRRPVWNLSGEEWDCSADSHLLRLARDKIRLGKGSYSVYLYADSRYRGGSPFKDMAHLLNDLAEFFRGENPDKNLQEYLDQCYVTLTMSDEVVVPEQSHPPASKKGEALIELSCARDNVFFARPFRITRDTRVRLYAMGEAIWRGELLADYAWVEKAASGETAWLMDMPDSEHAGGALKNRYFLGDIPLAQGEYLLSYITDDSHSCEAWNASPPYDPEGWGVMLSAGQGFRRDDLVKIDYDELQNDPTILVKLIHVRDDEHVRQEFRLGEPTRVHIYAFGEGGRDDMWDTGWIVNLKKRQTVWRLNYRDTEWGGGDKKNRLYDGVIELEPGRYEAHYATDGSHAFGNWNARPPLEPHRWGLTIQVAE